MSHKTIGDALYAAGHAQTIFVNRENIARRDIRPFNPYAPWSGFASRNPPAEFEARYGQGSWSRKGDLVGERFAEDAVETVARHPSNPLNLRNNTTYVITEQDRVDVKMVKGKSGNASVYDSYFLPMAAQLTGGHATPTPPPTTPAVPTPPAKPPTKPVKPPVVPVVPPTPPTSPPTPSTPTPSPVTGEYLGYWLALPTSEAIRIVLANLQALRVLGKGKPLSVTLDTVIRHGTAAWRKVKAELS